MTRIRMLVLLPWCLASLPAVAQERPDLQAQILYAFYTEDANALTSLAQTLSTQAQAQAQANGSDGALRYDVAHVQYRIGLLAVPSHAKDADAAFAACVDQLKSVLETDSSNVESLALQSACYLNLSNLHRLEAVLLRSLSEGRMRRAAELAPHNPRVQLLAAENELIRAKGGSAQNARAFGNLQNAARTFEQSSAGADAPGWGDAETFLELGRQFAARGEFLNARNWIEKSLIIAPDYKAAQRQLAMLVRR